jgi:hypothetical protein
MTFQKSVALFTAAFLFLSFSVLARISHSEPTVELPPGRVSVLSVARRPERNPVARLQQPSPLWRRITDYG